MNRGRPREFDTDQALERAIMVFWQRGYRGTSLDDLTEAMAINRPSLYAAFGDKETLFLQAVDRYRELYVLPSAKKLAEAVDLRSGLIEFLRGLAGLVSGGETPPGCLIACLLSEEAGTTAVIQQKLANSIAGADAHFETVFEKHKSELQNGLSPSAAARILTTSVHGMAMRARSGAGRETLHEIGHSIIFLLLGDRGK